MNNYAESKKIGEIAVNDYFPLNYVFRNIELF